MSFAKKVSKQLFELEKLSKDVKRDLESALDKNVLPMLERLLRFNIMANLYDYSETNSIPRHKTIENAFTKMEKILPNFKWNRSGSFTKSGAKDLVNENLSISMNSKPMRVSVKATGRLEEFEKGQVNWGAMRRFFYSRFVRRKIEKEYPNEYKSFYNDLKKLFSFTKDPTMDSRPYVSHAVKKNSLRLHESIMDEIQDMFPNNKESWIQRRR